MIVISDVICVVIRAEGGWSITRINFPSYFFQTNKTLSPRFLHLISFYNDKSLHLFSFLT